MMGCHADTTSLAKVIKLQPAIVDMSVEVRSKFVKLDKETRSKKKDTFTNVKVLQIYVTWEKWNK